ncbi:MAG: DUF3073 domain-containing protein [Actinomycetaceae bacterium]|nr:DUF3073 domain-containing protein [Actinomycetaceae bacterium]MDY6083508.1 DUF3073 domain-containing protein [Actinomycetaceae bacterium]
MGRGRQRAKQRKVARDLKYFTPDTDYQALERELRQKQNQRDDDDEYEEDGYYNPDDIPPATD